MVFTTLAQPEAGAGIAVTGSGTRILMRDLIRLAEHVHHYQIVYRHQTAEPLYLGRTKRLATNARRHHAHPSWNNGGLTDAPDLMNTGGDTLNHHFHPEELHPPRDARDHDDDG